MHNGVNTSYQRRKARKLQRARESRKRESEQKYMQVDRFLAFFEQEYKKYYQRQITIGYKEGWYYFLNMKKRHREMEVLLFNIMARLQELDSPTPNED
jgi:flagellar biosynthesis/type III secretory pathway protein FliH